MTHKERAKIALRERHEECENPLHSGYADKDRSECRGCIIGFIAEAIRDAVDEALAGVEEWCDERDDWRRCMALYGNDAMTEAAWAFGTVSGEVARRRGLLREER